MSTNNVASYGWRSSSPPRTSHFLSPKIKQIVTNLSVRRVADLGSGNGALCSELSAMNLEVVGIENDGDGVLVSQSAYPQLRFYNFGVQDDPAKLLAHEERFDAVISTEVIEHLFSPHLLPQFAHAILRDDGYLLLSTPYHGYLKNLALSILGKWDHHHTALWHGGHIKFWSRATLTKLLEENGFQVQRFYGAGRFPYAWKSMLILAKKV